jgi:hypothetical protein
MENPMRQIAFYQHIETGALKGSVIKTSQKHDADTWPRVLADLFLAQFTGECITNTRQERVRVSGLALEPVAA